MKKLIALILIGLTITSIGFAEGIDIGSMTFEQLIELNERVIKEISTRPEWKEVTVPEGVYEIGVDIPSGYWTIQINEGYASIEYGSTVNQSMTGIEWDGKLYNGTIVDKDDEYNSDTFNDSVSLQLDDGNWIAIQGKPVVFTPHIKQLLGF